jgi:ABC-type multidrug transport system permease subunit
MVGVIGIGITILVFVILGNPSAGGAIQPALLPPFWRAISSALPNGAAVDSVRRIIYFGAAGIGGHLIVLASYAAGGLIIAIIGAIIKQHFRDARSRA